MLQFVLAGLVLGGIYAITSAGIVVTYRATGVLNFGFGALAYFIARFFYFLNTQHGWAIIPAAVVSLLVVAPGIGIILYYALFRALRMAAPLIKVVATIGLSVCLPPLAVVLFGNQPIYAAPGLAPQPVHIYHWLGVPITANQLFVYGAVLIVMVAGALILQFTEVGLRVRAMVDSPAMMSLSGVSPGRVSVGVWAVSTFLAGLAGILAAPIVGLDPTDSTLLMIAAFAAVIVGKLRNLPVTVVAALLIGIIGGLIQKYLPSTSTLTADIIPSVPFAVAAAALIYNTIRWGRTNESEGVGGALDRAITPQSGPSVASSAAEERVMRKIIGTGGWRPSAIIVGIILVLAFTLSQYWVGLLALGLAYAVVFLSYTLVTGEGGMIWLCQITFAGVGAITTAQLATNHGWPLTLAILAGGGIAAVMGVVIGLLTIRLGDLYVALVTLTFALLMDNIAFSRNVFQQDGAGVSVGSLPYATSPAALTVATLVLFCILGLIVVNLRRSTTGMAMAAVRHSEPGARTVGISVLQMKVIVSGVAAGIAGLGGGLLAVNFGAANPADFTTLAGLTWFAVLVTAGIRSNMAALIGGLMFSVLPGIVTLYLTGSWGEVPPILFGLGAIMLARDPDGFVMQNAKAILRLFTRMMIRSSGSPGDGDTGQPSEDSNLSLAGNGSTAVGGEA
jgi:branched-chain amino acid transport system permease protein